VPGRWSSRALKVRRPKLLLLLLLLVLAASGSSVRAASMAPPIPGLAHYVYVDLSQQRLYEVHHHAVTDVLHVSTGGGYRYTSSDGVSRIAATPVGRFRIYSKLAGWHRSYLGSMYYPSYFDGGYAIHGDPYVPAYPVSHGCIRIPMGAAVGFYERNPIGTPVFVVR
jgi:lipoprotein-anchoring transpeptidase ErfK/SrfK